MALRDAFADLLDAGTPANPANPAKTRADTGPQPDLGGCESLRILRIVDGTSNKFAGFADIRKPENGQQTRANACDSQNSQLSQGVRAKTCASCSNRLRHGTCGEPVAAGLSPKFEIRWPPVGHAATCPAFAAKAQTLPDRPYKLSQADADDLAEKLVLRDRDADGWHSCAECLHGRGARCPDGSPLPVGLLHRCSAFASAVPST